MGNLEVNKLNQVQQTQQAEVKKAKTQKAHKGLFGRKKVEPSNTGTKVEQTGGASTQKTTATTFKVGEGGISQQQAEFLVNTAKLLVANQDGTFTLVQGKTANDVKNALNEYNKTLPQVFELPETLYNKLGDDVKARLAKSGEQQYTCSAEDAPEVHRALGQIEGVTANNPAADEGTGEAKIDFETTETETTKYPDYLAQDDIKNADLSKRAGRKDFHEKTSTALNKWIENNKDVYEYSSAQMLHGKKVDKKVSKLAKEFPTAGRALKHLAEMESTPQEYKDEIQNALQEAKKDLDGLYELYKNGKQRFMSFEDFKGRTDLHDIYAYEKICQGEELLSRDEILTMCATQEVMAKRAKSERKVKNDKKDFVKEMANREVQMYKDRQDFENAVPCWNADEAKAGKGLKDGKTYNDIGKWGRKLVMGSPSTFCDEVKDDGKFDFEADGKKYKLNKEKYQNYFFENSFSGFDEGKFGEQYAKEGRLTLNEARSNLTERNGDLENDKTAEEILHTGKRANNKINNRELNRYRNAAKAAGIHVDKNGTVAKRALHVARDAAIGAGIGFGTAGLGTIGTGIAIAGSLAPEVIPYFGKTADRTITGTVHDELVTHDYYTDEFGTTEVTHKMNRDIPYEQTVEGQEYSGTVSSNERQYSNSGNSYGTQMRNGGIIGAAGGLLTGLISMNKINAKGERWDHVINLEQPIKQAEKTENQKKEAIVLDKPKVQTYTYQVQKEKTLESEKLVKYRGLEAYNVLYPNVGKNDFINAYIKAFNEMFGTDLKRGQMPDKFYAIPIEVNGQTINPADNWKNTYKTITEGKQGTSTRIVKGKDNIQASASASALRRGYI